MVNSKNPGRFDKYVMELGLHSGVSKASNPYFKKDKNLNYLFLLDDHNSEIIEREIQEDDGYIQFTKMIVEYYKTKNHKVFPEYDEDAVKAVVRMIDTENSTNVWRFNREKLLNMVAYIVKRENKFWKELISSNKVVRKKLVKKLAKAAQGQDITEDQEEGAQPNSLASKVCKYFAQYIKGDKDTNLYFINDSFVRHTLRYYYHFYCKKDLNKTDIENYEYDQLFDKLDEIYKKAKKTSHITRGRMDHIMWYCYKNSGNTNKYTRDANIKTISEFELKGLCETFIKVYGVISLDDVVSLIHIKYSNFTLENLNSFLLNPQPNCVVKDNYLVNVKYTDDEIQSLIALGERKEIYRPGKLIVKPNKLDWGNNHVKSLKKCLLETYGASFNDLINQKIDELLVKLSKADYPSLENTIQEFAMLNEGNEISNKTKIKNSLKKVFEFTRLPKYQGHTEDEIKRQSV